MADTASAVRARVDPLESGLQAGQAMPRISQEGGDLLALERVV